MPDGVCPFAEWIPGVYSYQAGGANRVGWCDHTAGGYYSTLKSAEFWNSSGVSVHFSISQLGEICQTVNIFDTAFAQGRLGSPVNWQPYAAMGHQNPNGYLISTEHEDKTVTNYQWSQEMYEADLRLKRWCVEEVRRVQGVDLLLFAIDSLAGHYMFDPQNRAYCPGSGWPRDRLYHDLTSASVPAPPPEEENDMHSHHSWATWFTGREFGASEELFTMQAIADFSLPADAKAVLLQPVLETGDVEFFHGGTAIPAAELGAWTLIANLAEDGTLTFRSAEGCKFQELHCVGYYR